MTNVSTSSEPHDGNGNDHVLRPRPRKPLHSQLSYISNASDLDNGHLEAPETGQGTGMTR